MKKLFLSLAVCAAFFTSCDDDSVMNQSAEIESSFSMKYPNASKVEWEKEGIYSVAEFNIDLMEADAWFDTNAKWVMTETDITPQMLPEEVTKAIQTSEYATWRIDDVDLIERPDLENIYIVEVELGKIDKDLHYTAAGKFLKADSNDNSHMEYLPK